MDKIIISKDMPVDIAGWMIYTKMLEANHKMTIGEFKDNVVFPSKEYENEFMKYWSN
jgi:hypothetical protein